MLPPSAPPQSVPPFQTQPYGPPQQPRPPFNNHGSFNNQGSFQPRPPRACFLCGDLNHIKPNCPFNPLRRQTPRPPANVSAPMDPTCQVQLTMDSAEDADEVRASAERIRRRKRPLNAGDFKALATELVKELTNINQNPPKQHSNSPKKSINSGGPTTRRRIERREPPLADDQHPHTRSRSPSSHSKVGSISSNAAAPRMRSIFEKQTKALPIKVIQKQLDDVGIDWVDNDFRSANKKASKISELAAHLASQAIKDLKDASM